MTKFIEVTDISGNSMYVNFDTVAAFYIDKSHPAKSTELCFKSTISGGMYIKETPSEILRKLNVK